MEALCNSETPSLAGADALTEYLDNIVGRDGVNWYFSNSSRKRITFLFAAIGWNPIEALGHLVSRVHYILSGKFILQGQIYAYEKKFKESIILSSLYDLAAKILTTALFILIGVPAREVVAIAGLFLPQIALDAYTKIDEFFKIPSRKYLEEELTTVLNHYKTLDLAAKTQKSAPSQVNLQSANLFKIKVNHFSQILKIGFHSLSDHNKNNFRDLALFFAGCYQKHHPSLLIVNELIKEEKEASTPEEKQFVKLCKFLQTAVEAFEVVKDSNRDLDPAVAKALLGQKDALKSEFCL